MIHAHATSLLILTLAGQCLAQNRAQRQAKFFAPDVVQRIELEVADKDLQRLLDALPERIYVPATFRWNDVVLQRIGLRYKGNSSSTRQQKHKRSFLLKFNEFTKGQRFLGLRRVALDNGVQFGSLFSERLITDILREVGVLASRCNYARVTLNGKYIGVYVNVERIDKAFVKQHFKGDKGALFKVNTGGPGADLRYVGDDPLLYTRAFEQKAGEKSADYRDLMRFIKELNETPTARSGACR